MKQATTNVSILESDTIKRRRVVRNWLVSSTSPTSVDQLSFTARDTEGRRIWWEVEPPKTDYWHAHQILGRAYAFEFLDLINNPNRSEEDYVPDHALSFILAAMIRNSWKDWRHSTVAEGFMEVIGEFLISGKVSR